ncbi:MAG: ABC transporter transmembrane domain-containing protein, partial [Flavobacteriales bacterium]|nr:ABC transporter transmembrane domain-containing protein [Flavobacteriales bacterium]
MRPLLKLNPYFVRYRGRMLLGVVFVALSNLFAVYSPQVVREAIDLIAAGIAQAPLPAGQQRLEVPAMLNDWVGWTGIDLAGRLGDPAAHGGVRAVVAWLAALLGLLFLAFALLRGFFMFLMRQTIIVVSRLIEHDLKNTVHAHYQRLDRAFYKRNSTGDLMNRISEDVGKVRMYLGPAVMYTLGLVVLFVLCIAFMLRVSVELTLWTLAPLPVMSVLIYLVSEVINRRSTRAQQ